MAYQTTGKTTGMDVFQRAITMMDELNDDGKYKHEDTEEYRKRSLAILNTIAPELYPFSDTYKKNQAWEVGRRPVMAWMESLYDNIDLDDYCAGTVLPYGLAAHLLMDENPTSANFFQQRYDELKVSLMRGLPAESEEIVDVYGGLGPYNEFGMWS